MAIDILGKLDRALNILDVIPSKKSGAIKLTRGAANLLRLYLTKSKIDARKLPDMEHAWQLRTLNQQLNYWRSQSITLQSKCVALDMDNKVLKSEIDRLKRKREASK